jgi:hypothetical protein
LADPLGDSSQQTFDQGIFDLSKLTGRIALLVLHAFQTIKNQQVSSTRRQSITQQMQQARAFRRCWRRVSAAKVPMKLLQEIAGVRFLIETPDEETGGAQRLLRPAEFVEEMSGDGGLARSAQPHEGNNARGTVAPQGPQLIKLPFSPHELRSYWQGMDQAMIGRM